MPLGVWLEVSTGMTAPPPNARLDLYGEAVGNNDDQTLVLIR